MVRACRRASRQGPDKLALSCPLSYSFSHSSMQNQKSLALHSSCCRASNRDDIDIEKLSALAHIELTENEKTDLGTDLERIIDWFGELQELDVTGVDPLLRAGVSDLCGDASWLREDVACLDQARAEQMLGQVPDGRLSRDGFVQVPKDQ